MKAKDLRAGDRIRLLHVPEPDLKDRENAQQGSDWIPTATVLEYLIATRPVVTISGIDAWGMPWFDAHLVWNGEDQHHTIAIFDDDSWEPVERASNG